MAFYTNNNNVGLRCFVKNEEILILNPSFSNSETTKSDRVKCSIPEIINTAVQNGSDKPENKETHINSVAISNCSTLIAACTANNYLHLWKQSENDWKMCNVRPLIRKCQKMLFTNSSSDIIVADRSGDVFRFSATISEEPGSFLLGHISFILDIAISSNDKYLATCDRDGKIRVSCYPNSYNILSYCLGNQEFVSSVQFLQLSEEMLLSTSGDGTVRLWKYRESGSEQANVVLHENEILRENCKVSERDDHVKESLESQGASSGNLVLSEMQIQFSVRSVKYCNEHHLCAVLFHLQSGIAIFHLSQVGNLEFKQFLSLSSLPLDAVFGTDGKLLVLLKQDADALVYFNYSAENETFIEACDEKIPQSVQDFYSEFSSSIAFPDDFVTLFKRSYETPDDNDDCNKSKKIKN